jgi:biotin synthase
MSILEQITALALEKAPLTREQCHHLIQFPDQEMLTLLDAAFSVRKKYCGMKVHIHVLTNAKSGLCPEDCHYCSQSSVSNADIPRYRLLPTDQLRDEAQRARRLKARRYCMAMSGRGPHDSEIDELCNTVRAIKQDGDISICCSLGILTSGQAIRLKEAGVNRINHNLNTSENHHSNICTTHTFRDRLDTLRNCREAGLELCSGGIFGQGETNEDIIDFALELNRLGPESIPVNFLTPIQGTPFEKLDTGLTPYRCLKILCLMRFMNPDREIRIAGGREHHLRHLQSLALYPCNSLFVTGYLTTPGQRGDEAIQMIRDLGFTIEYSDDGSTHTEAAEEDQSGMPVTRSATVAESALFPAK